MFQNFFGINFLGKLHNTKQHIQFIRWLQDDIELPRDILNVFLTSYSNAGHIEDKTLIPIKKQNILADFKNCHYFIFEICSLKLYERDGFQVQHEFTNDYNCITQSETDLYNDLLIIRSLVPASATIIFQIHFRPNIIYADASKCVENRETIYTTVKRFIAADNNKNYLHDPSLMLKDYTNLFDGNTHFTSKGYNENFNYIYKNYIMKSTD